MDLFFVKFFSLKIKFFLLCFFLIQKVISVDDAVLKKIILDFELKKTTEFKIFFCLKVLGVISVLGFSIIKLVNYLLEKHFKSYREELKELKDRFTAFEAKYSIQQNKIDELEKKIEKMKEFGEAELEEIHSEFETFNQKFQNIFQQIGIHEDGCIDEGERSLIDIIANVKTDMIGLENNVDALKKKLQSISMNINTNRNNRSGSDITASSSIFDGSSKLIRIQ